MKKTFITLMILLVAVVAVFSGCSGNTGTAKKKIGILSAEATHGWVAAVAYNATERCKELNDKIEYKLCTAVDAIQMAEQLDELLAWGAEAIVMFPQWEGMAAPIKAAVDRGITIVNFDIEIAVEGVYHVAGDNEDMGVRGAEYITEKIGAEGTVVMLDVPSAGSVSTLRKKGFVEKMTEIAPEANILTFDTNFSREDGYNDFKSVLESVAHIDAVYSIDDETSIGVLQAIAEAGRTDIKVVTGGGGCQEYFNMMPSNSGIWIQSALYSPAMVRDAVDVAFAVLNKENIAKVKIIPTTIVDRTNFQNYLDENSPY